mmetsp:Transcript_43372/g.80669  ORF Transcript_43372/g.80669 Transcript_43372/m.80669 type:complete len:351 (-) Transcript_43372:809-1861(-)
MHVHWSTPSNRGTQEKANVPRTKVERHHTDLDVAKSFKLRKMQGAPRTCVGMLQCSVRLNIRRCTLRPTITRAGAEQGKQLYYTNECPQHSPDEYQDDFILLERGMQHSLELRVGKILHFLPYRILHVQCLGHVLVRLIDDRWQLLSYLRGDVLLHPRELLRSHCRDRHWLQPTDHVLRENNRVRAQHREEVPAERPRQYGVPDRLRVEDLHAVDARERLRNLHLPFQEDAVNGEAAEFLRLEGAEDHLQGKPIRRPADKKAKHGKDPAAIVEEPDDHLEASEQKPEVETRSPNEVEFFVATLFEYLIHEGLIFHAGSNRHLFDVLPDIRVRFHCRCLRLTLFSLYTEGA